jgi:hypothetical protein
MSTDSGFDAAALQFEQSQKGEDRRVESERRQSAQGLLELRARREGSVTDRRTSSRWTNAAGRAWDALFGRVK